MGCFRRSRGKRTAAGEPSQVKSSSGSFLRSSKPPPPQVNPEDDAWLISRLFVAWMIKPLRIAARDDVTSEDFGPPAKKDDVHLVYGKLQQYLKEENNKLLPALVKLISLRTLFIGFMLTVIQAASQIAVPFLTKAILNSLTGQDPLTTGQLWGVAIGSFLLPFIGALCQAHVLLISRRSSLHMFIALTQTIFAKALAKSDVSIGRANNLIANDAGVAMERSIQMFFPLLVSPFQVGVLLWLLYRELGVGIFAGMGALFVVLPIVGIIFARIQRFNSSIMRASDFRQKLINEFLSAIRIVKAYAWEEPLLDKVEKARERELEEIRKHALTLNVGLSLSFLQLSNIMQMVTIWTYYATGGVFSPAIIFPALQLFALIQAPLNSLPNSIATGIQTFVAIGRINAFLNEPDIEFHPEDQRFLPIESPQPGEILLALESCSFTWRESSAQELKRAPFVFSSISLELRRGELVAVISRLGGGKTSFLKAILGEMSKTSGRLTQRGKVSYAQQDAFVINGTLRENILFGLPFDEERYYQVIDQCALTADMAMFKGGDNIMCGERGITLSGGQMARVCLARALYAYSDVVLLDDPLSAVDSHVSDKLFDTFRTSSLLRNRLVILVTNQLHRLKRVDKIITFGSQGEYIGCDTFEEFSKRKLDLGISEEENYADDVSSVSTLDKDGMDAHAIQEKETGGRLLAKQVSMKSMEEDAEELFEAEHTRSGSLSIHIFGLYIKAAGKPLAFFAFLTCVLYMMLPSAGQIIISNLTNEQVKCGMVKCPDQKVLTYLGWYTFALGLSFFICVVSGVSMAYVRVRSARSLHHLLLETLSKASIAFFDSTPIGRISNRFSKDMAMIDTLLSQFFMWVCVTASIVLGAILSVAYSTKGVFLGITVPVFFAFYLLFRFQRRGGANIHRLEGLTRAPVYSLFAETLNGRFTIRAFQQEERFKDLNMSFLRQNAVPFYLGRTGLPAFLTTALNVIGLFSTGSVTLFVVFSGVVSASDAGLALSTVSAIVSTLYFTVFILQDFELQLNAVERVDVFVKNVNDWELPWYKPDLDPKQDWPSKGHIQIKGLYVGYRKGPDVIKNLTLDILPEQKVGVVGRTGSGKSTFLRVLLRLTEPRNGSILIDGVNITDIGLSVLRRRLGIIPQEPVLFYETIRYNLDPFGQYSDAEIFETLDLVGLGDFIRGMSLDYTVSEAGTNFSQGQRQLLCVVRALLRKTKILLLDEPSASIDQASDQILQKTIRTAFVHCTTITVAHRLSSIADSDKIVVLSHGDLVEFDHPHVLLSKEDGHFRGMVNVLEDSERRLCEAMAEAAYNKVQQPGEETANL